MEFRNRGAPFLLGGKTLIHLALLGSSLPKIALWCLFFGTARTSPLFVGTDKRAFLGRPLQRALGRPLRMDRTNSWATSRGVGMWLVPDPL